VDVAPCVKVIRSGLTESVHSLDVAVCDASGSLVAWAGRPDRFVFARSSMKPLQASVALSAIAEELPDDELAVMCASHNGEPVHVRAVIALLGRGGLGVSALQNPASWPMDDRARAESHSAAPELGDCSGKHAGMLLACVRSGWDTATYREPDHPLQQRILDAVVSWTGWVDLKVGVDGCGVPVHGMPLRSMATLYARLASPQGDDEIHRSAVSAVGAMRAEPYMVGGRGRLDTDLMSVAPDIVAKEGAEALACAGVSSAALGVAVKVADGGHRATAPALIRVLSLLGALEPDRLPSLDRHAAPRVLGGGQPVGELAVDLELVRPS
jgi:L-asparaginase II